MRSAAQTPNNPFRPETGVNRVSSAPREVRQNDTPIGQPTSRGDGRTPLLVEDLLRRHPSLVHEID